MLEPVLGAVVAAREHQDHRVAALERGQPVEPARVVGERVVRIRRGSIRCEQGLLRIVAREVLATAIGRPVWPLIRFTAALTPV